MRVFLSYRRADDLFLAGRLRDRLAANFGEENVFFDVDSIAPGTDFREVIRQHVDEADVVLAMIGPRWDSTKLAMTGDFVRMELGESLRQHKPLIPVLIADTAMPGPAELPEELAAIAFLNALRIRPDPDFHSDSDRLIEAVTAAQERERARVVEEQRDRVALSESRQKSTSEVELVTMRENAEVAEDVRLAAEAEVGAGKDRGRRRRHRYAVTVSVAVALGAALVTAIAVAASRGEGPDADPVAGQLGEWAAQVTGSGGTEIRTERADSSAGDEPAWDVNEQRLAYVPTSSTGESECGLCGIKNGSEGPVELVPASDAGNLHAPAWSESGSLYYAQTNGCDPSPTCGDEIFLTRPGRASAPRRVPTSNLVGVRDLEVDPQSRDDNIDEVTVAVADEHSARLIRGGIDKPLSNGKGIDDLTYSANSHVIVGLPEGPTHELEVWTRQGDPIDTVDLRELLAAAIEDGIDTGLDVASADLIAVSASGGSSDQQFAVVLRDAARKVGGVEIEVPYDENPTAQLHATPRAIGLVSIPYALYRDAELEELVRLQAPDG